MSQLTEHMILAYSCNRIYALSFLYAKDSEVMSRHKSPGTRPILKRSLLPLVASMLVAVTAAAGCAPTENPGNPTLSLADSYSPKHPFGKYGVSVFLDKLKEDGIDTEYYPSGQMGNAEDLASLISTDNIDIGPASAAYLEDKLPLSSVGDLPMMTTDACVASNSMMDLLDEDGVLYKEEYEDRELRPLWVSIIPGYEVMTSKTKVEDPTDVRGLLLRSSGGAFDVTMETIGASAVSMSAADTYEAMTRNTVDGTAMPFVSVPSYNLEQVANYSTKGLNLGSVGIPYVISERTWDGLTSQEQHKVTDAAAKAQQSLCAGLNKEKSEAESLMKDAGVEFTPITGDAKDQWTDELSRAKSDWATSLDSAGLPGTEVLTEFEKAVTKNERNRSNS
jgi:TRAP-type C4-dicarboxylate transport system substrate-binding protein